jgi:N-acetylglutamate synthase-like GNAT family acetyltransferase
MEPDVPLGLKEEQDDELIFEDVRAEGGARVTMGVPKDANEPAEIFDMCVMDEERGGGKGTELLNDAEKTAEEFGVDALNVIIGDEAGDPEPFFESQGFERGMYEEGELKEEETDNWHQFTKRF